MRFLLDTQIYLWLVTGDPRLPSKATKLLDSAESTFVSSASLWEIAIKVRLGKLKGDVQEMIDDLEPSGYRALPVLPHHTVAVAQFSLHHRDPFDRILIAQAISEQIWLLTTDAQLPQYSDRVIRV